MTAIVKALYQFQSIGAEINTQVLPGYNHGDIVIDKCEATEATRKLHIGGMQMLDTVLMARHEGSVESLRALVNSTCQLAGCQGWAAVLDSDKYLDAVRQRGYTPEVERIFSSLSKEEGLEYGRIKLLFDGRSATTIYEQDGDVATCAILLSSIAGERP